MSDRVGADPRNGYCGMEERVRMDKKFIFIAAGILAVVSIAIAIAVIFNRPNASFSGSVIDPPLPAPNFTLTNQTGSISSLSSYQGKFVLLFFGFTHCTDECPATMALLHIVREQLGKNADRVQVVFVTTDPARDNRAAVDEYVKRFDPTFVGFTGDQTTLKKIWSDYGVTVLDNGETHSTIVYLINPEGNIQLTYPSSTSPDDLVADLNILLK
jgi:protein SCO1/2